MSTVTMPPVDIRPRAHGALVASFRDSLFEGEPPGLQRLTNKTDERPKNGSPQLEAILDALFEQCPTVIDHIDVTDKWLFIAYSETPEDRELIEALIERPVE